MKRRDTYLTKQFQCYSWSVYPVLMNRQFQLASTNWYMNFSIHFRVNLTSAKIFRPLIARKFELLCHTAVRWLHFIRGDDESNGEKEDDDDADSEEDVMPHLAVSTEEMHVSRAKLLQAFTTTLQRTPSWTGWRRTAVRSVCRRWAWT